MRIGKYYFGQLQNLQHLVEDNKQPPDQENKAENGNLLTDSAVSIETIRTAYENKNQWGGTVRSVIDVVAAFTALSGLETSKIRPEADRELAFVDEMLKVSCFDSAGIISLFSEIGIEDKCLLFLKYMPTHKWEWDDNGTIRKENGIVKLIHFPWTAYRYKVTPKEHDILNAESFSYTTGSQTIDQNSREFIGKSFQFSYRRFSSGDATDINTSNPPARNFLSDCIFLDIAQARQSTNNRLFAEPKPDLECENSREAREMIAVMAEKEAVKLKRTLFVHSGKLTFKTPDTTANIQEEIDNLKRSLSLKTGVPIQYFGDAHTLGSKNVADNSEQQMMLMEKNRGIFESLIIEAIEKAFAMLINVPFLNPNAIKINFARTTTADWDRVTNIFFPLAIEGKLSLQTLLEKIPGIDPAKEMERIEKERAESNNRESEKQREINEVMERAMSNDRARLQENRNNEK